MKESFVPMFRVAACVFTQHNLGLIAAAALVCVLSWAGAVLVLDRIKAAPAGLRRAWRLLAALAAGGGTWATHFVAMLAYQPGLPIAFDLPLTLVSFAVGVVGAWAAFEIYGAMPGRGGRIAAGLTLGATIAALHFVGMQGLVAAAQRLWAWDLVAAALLLACAFSIGGIQVDAMATSPRGKAGACGLFVLGVVALHFTGMGALTLVPSAATAQPDAPLNRLGLAVTVALGALVLLVGAAAFSLADRRLAAAKLSAMRRMQRLADAAFEGILFHDGATILDANRRSAALIGLDVEEVIGRPLASFLKPGAEPQVSDEERASGDYQFETIVVGPKGELPVEVHTRLFNKAEGLYVSAVRDNSLRRRAETAEAENIAKSHYLANMSHELRTPLNAIVGYAELIAEETDDADVCGDAEAIRSSARHLLALINDILDLSKTEAGKVDLIMDDCDLAGLLAECCCVVRPEAAKRGVALSCASDARIGVVKVDGLRLKQCLLNLLSNAVKFTHDGEVKVSARLIEDGDGGLEIVVRDTGIGMSEEQIGRVFKAFAQADSSITRHYGGTGLGLAITERLIKLMGGTIGVESELGRGSTFKVRLPAASTAPRQLSRVA
jgi:signal transduction histidine kinase